MVYHMSLPLAALLLLWSPAVSSLLVSPAQRVVQRATPQLTRHTTPLLAESEPEVMTGETRVLTAADMEEVGNLVEDDEWLGLGMEMAIVLRSALRESVKKNVREFTGNDDYKIGDLSKAADAKIKEEVARLRGKDEYELGDLSLALDQIAKEEVCKLTGKDDYEVQQNQHMNTRTYEHGHGRARSSGARPV